MHFLEMKEFFFSRSLQKNEIIKVLNLLKFKKLFIFCDPSLEIYLYLLQHFDLFCANCENIASTTRKSF